MHEIAVFFTPRTIYQTTSKINGNIQVVELLGKRSIKVGGLQQSGDMVEMLWRKGIEEVLSSKYQVLSILILGLGGGSVIKVINQYFPKANITGVELDPVIVDISNNYFNLKQAKNLAIKIIDAFSYVKKTNEKFDLILVDLYVGQSTPQFLESTTFLANIKRILSPKGVVFFNRLRGKGREPELKDFQKKLAGFFTVVNSVNPLINTIFICS